MDAADPGGLGGTYAGSPVACAAALVVLDVIEEEKLLIRAKAIGHNHQGTLEDLAKRNDVVPVGVIRGPGAMVGFKIMTSNGKNEPDADATKRVTTAAMNRGLVLLSCGVYNTTTRLLLPRTASDAILNEGLDILDKALKEAVARS